VKREQRRPLVLIHWVPAFAGMTVINRAPVPFPGSSNMKLETQSLKIEHHDFQQAGQRNLTLPS
jgi:hypothetical protein